ncbi:MAG: HAMP domain-containing protein [Spirochaetales bacterium]|nr:HAMP domain-containing protein [Spirochaetales bacterium]
MKKKEKSSFFRTIGGKLILISSVVILLSLGILTIVSMTRMSGALNAAAQEKLQAIQAEKQKIVLDIIERSKNDCEVIASTVDVKLATEDLIRYHQEMNISATGSYDTTGRGAELTKTYEEIFEGINRNLQKYNDIYEYYDVFIICAKHGHIMYTNAREADLGENLSVGQYSNINIGNLWKEVTTTGKTTIVDLEAYAPSGGLPSMFMGTPVMDNGEMLAIIALQINNQKISDLLTNSAGMGETGEVYCTGEDLIMRTESRFSKTGETAILRQRVDSPAGRVLEQMDSKVFMDKLIDYTGQEVLSVYSHLTIDNEVNSDFDWAIIAEIATAEIMTPIINLIWVIAIIAVVILIIAVIVMIFFSRTISVPIQAGVEAAELISKGNLNFSIEEKYLNRQDEIGQLSGALQGMIQKLSEIVGSVLSGSEQIASASEQLAAGNQDLSNRTEQQATALEETSSAVEEMNSAIKSNADNTVTADQLSREAVVKTDDGALAVGRMVESMTDISTSSNKIADIIEVITNIAFQTNLLALNASIEAARAGEQGKGFAVVAVEVRKLAKRSDKAAEEITAIIKNSNLQVDKGVEIANSAGTVLEEINNSVKKVTALVSEISAASQEQLSSVDQIDKTLSSLDENTQRNAALVEEAASSTEELSAQAQELNTAIQFFKLDSGDQKKANSTGKAQKPGAHLLSEPGKQKRDQTTGLKSGSPASGYKVESYESFSDLVDEGEFDEF